MRDPGAELATLLRSMSSPTPLPELQRRALDRGLTDADGLRSLVAQLVGAGVATECKRPRGRAPSLRVHSRRPLSELPMESLRCSGAAKPPGGRTSTARRGSQPTCTAPSGRSNTGIAGSSA
ncbi:hypothetical protein W7U_15890 [Mycobacterium sp. H4Y]|nr:hypothetical protein W7U_15890 [Mycobacterium sp. H4Y]